MKYIFFILVTFCYTQLQAQHEARDVYNQAQQISTNKYIIEDDQIAIDMSFGEASVINDEILRNIERGNIRRVDLVYSDYPKNLSFESLNISRLNNLKKRIPGLFDIDSIKWTMVRQTDCITKTQAEELFHGFVFSTKKSLDHSIQVDYQKNITKIKETYFSLEPEDRKFLAMGNDTLAFDILERNVHNWKEVTIVSDWTASMYPFTTQILRWHISRFGESNIRNFVFFNDGDDKKTKDKKLGDTGGIYAIKADSLQEVINLMKVVMEKGDGGDLPENDIESLLYAMESFPDSKEFVLIADNRSAVRDIALLTKIDRPVRVILGRIFMDDLAYIKGAYIKLALLTGGSLHTRYQDYTNPYELEQLTKEVLIARRRLRALGKIK
ncbi:hypothetical protein [Chondrinema litorale]|uniref:hypothetical protein n=1 Tax=Chondrinema litorale TaxID=2994555 RepID=UPI002543F076|nr:hypothetical protein [Chondrinema litorale]UZR92921.1 hypothetical protein OQ292_13750 [Chondrinema litorale]